jgi:hypothetical protein
MAPTPAQARESGKRGGRPKGIGGALAKITEYKARELAAKNKTPLDVMIKNMHWWESRSEELTQLVEEKVKKVSAAEADKELAEALKEFNRAQDSMTKARDKSQSCAVDAAPYVHPRHASISVRQTNTIVNVKVNMLPPSGRDLVYDDGTDAAKSIDVVANVVGVDGESNGESTELSGAGSNGQLRETEDL